MKRRKFIQNSALAGSLTLVDPSHLIAGTFRSTGKDGIKDFPIVRVAPGERNFESPAIEKAITTFQKNVKDQELGWLFNNCFPNTLDTTVTYTNKNNKAKYLCHHGRHRRHVAAR